MKKVLLDWGYDRKAVWVDEDDLTLKVGTEVALTVCVVEKKLNVEYGDGWYEYLRSDEFDKVITDMDEKLRKSQQPTKGNGKGKHKTGGDAGRAGS